VTPELSSLLTQRDRQDARILAEPWLTVNFVGAEQIPYVVFPEGFKDVQLSGLGGSRQLAELKLDARYLR
jgi:hypothetical protein